MERLPKKELHGQNPVVTYATKQALNQFEAQSKTRPTPPPSGQQGPPPGGMGRGSSHFRPRGPGGFSSGRPPLISQPPPRTDMIRGPPPAIPPPGIPVVRLPPGVPPTSLAAPPPHLLAGPPPRMGVLPPHAHVNPAFLGGAPGYPPPASGGLSEVEFEEIMARNRTVSSSAIARAVQDAASNDYASAIETLVTAISLIKQSKVAHDDRCRILISSLQDTLHGTDIYVYHIRLSKIGYKTLAKIKFISFSSNHNMESIELISIIFSFFYGCYENFVKLTFMLLGQLI